MLYLHTDHSFLCLCLPVSVFVLSFCVSIPLFLCLCVSPSVSLYILMSVYLSCLSLPVCLSIFVTLSHSWLISSAWLVQLDTIERMRLLCCLLFVLNHMANVIESHIFHKKWSKRDFFIRSYVRVLFFTLSYNSLEKNVDIFFSASSPS